MFVARKLSKALMPKTVNTTVRLFQVCVMGGASEIGQVLSLMLRTEPSISKLVIHDTWETAPGVVIELSHIPVKSSLKGYLGEATMKQALSNSDLVLVVGKLIKSPGVSDKSCMEANTQFIKTVSSEIGKMPTMPFVGIATEPINTLVPMAAEIMRSVGGYDPKKLFGITTLDWIRAQTLFAKYHDLRPEDCFVPVIGGHSEKTTIPLISQSKPSSDMTDSQYIKFVNKLQKYDETVTEAKHGTAPTVSVAYGVLVFVREIMKALDGLPATVNAYVENNDFGTSYFSGQIQVDTNGVKEMTRYTNDISQYECQLLEKALVQLRKEVAMGKKVLEVE